MPSITIPWTMPIIGKTINANDTGKKLGFMGEFDCELTVSYWGESKYEDYGWELEAVTVDWTTPARRHHVTPESDPALWEVIMRGWKQDELSLSDKIIEKIGEDIEGARCDAAEYQLEDYR